MSERCRLICYHLGQLEYKESLRYQDLVHKAVKSESSADGVLLLLSYQSVVTFGKNSDKSFVKKGLPANISIVDTERGGQVTAHEPGQLVCYPIFPLSSFRLTPRLYVFLLEQVIINLLEIYGIVATRDLEHPGVWIGRDKICAIGIRIKERVSLHGLALNVCNNLETFRYITPCGIRDRGVTNLIQHTASAVELPKVELLLAKEFKNIFAFKELIICDYKMFYKQYLQN